MYEDNDMRPVYSPEIVDWCDDGEYQNSYSDDYDDYDYDDYDAGTREPIIIIPCPPLPGCSPQQCRPCPPSQCRPCPPSQCRPCPPSQCRPCPPSQCRPCPPSQCRPCPPSQCLPNCAP